MTEPAEMNVKNSASSESVHQGWVRIASRTD
jgi:hypothetical protein